MNSGPTIPSFPQRPPLTPSRPRSKPNHIPLVHRTTPHSQRIVPSSQWSDDDSCPEELTLPPPSDVPSRSVPTLSLTPVKFKVPACPTFIELASGQGHSLENNIDTGNSEETRTRPLSLSGPSRFVLPLSNCLGLQDRGQSSQIEPTSQVDEIELKVPSQRLFVDPILSAQANHCDVVPSIERCSHMLYFLRRSVDSLFRLGPNPDFCKTGVHIPELSSSKSPHQRIAVTSHHHHRAH